MLEEIGTTFPKQSLLSLPVANLSKVRDLEFFEGPLISEFRNASGEPFIYYWCDSDEHSNRWLVFRSARRDVIRYTHRQISLLDLLRFGLDGFVYVVDLGNDQEWNRIAFAPLAALPSSYFPLPSAMFNPTLASDGESATSTSAAT